MNKHAFPKYEPFILNVSPSYLLNKYIYKTKIQINFTQAHPTDNEVGCLLSAVKTLTSQCSMNLTRLPRIRT